MGNGFTSSLVTELTPGLLPKIRDYGCYFLSLLAIPQFKFCRALTVEQINDIYTAAVKVPEIMTENCLMGPRLCDVAEMAAAKFGEKFRMIQIGCDRRNMAGLAFYGGVIALADYHIDWVVINHDVVRADGGVTADGHWILGDRASVWIYNSNPSLKMGALKRIDAYREV